MSKILKKILIVVCFTFVVFLISKQTKVEASQEVTNLKEEILYYSDFNQFANGDDAITMWGKDNFFWCEAGAVATAKTREDGSHGIEFDLTGVQHSQMFGMGSSQAGFLSKVIEGETYVF